MMRKTLILAALILAALILTGCEEYENYTPSAADLTRIAVEFPEGPTKDALQATAVARYVEAEMLRQQAQEAQATADAANLEHDRRVAEMTAEAQAVDRARADAAQATRQALDAAERNNAINATATAQAAQATSQAVAVAIQATADQANVNATATIQTRKDEAEAVALQATTQAIELAAQRARWMNPLQFLGTVLLVAFLGAGAVFIGLRAWTLIEDRGRVVRRRADEGEPLIVMERDPDTGLQRVMLPLRSFGPVANDKAPDPKYQEGATKRQQAANVLHAQQAGEIARAKNSGKNGVRRLVTGLLPGPGRGDGTPRRDAPTIRVVDPNQVQPWIEDVEGQLLAEVSR